MEQRKIELKFAPTDHVVRADFLKRTHFGWSKQVGLNDVTLKAKMKTYHSENHGLKGSVENNKT